MKFVLCVLGRFVLAESGGSGMRSRTALETLSAYRRALLIRSASRRSGYSMGMDEIVSRRLIDKTSELRTLLAIILLLSLSTCATMAPPPKTPEEAQRQFAVETCSISCWDVGSLRSRLRCRYVEELTETGLKMVRDCACVCRPE